MPDSEEPADENLENPVGQKRELLNREDGRRLINATPSRQEEVIVRLPLEVGLRPGALISLDCGDWDAESGNLTVESKVGLREIPLQDGLREEVSLMIEEQHSPIPDSGIRPLFIDRHGNRLSQHSVRDIVLRAVSEAGITQKVFPHDLRVSWIVRQQQKTSEEE